MSATKNKPLISILVPTWNNAQYLRPMATSVFRNRTTPGLFEMVVVNNGHPASCDYLKAQKEVRVIDAGDNLGWEGGLKLALENTDSEFVVFMNDDTYIPPSSREWLLQLLHHFKDKTVGGVGPSSNTVMGYQNIFVDTPYTVYEAKFLIGFCAMLRRSAIEQVGGVDPSLPGGDDFDWSIRLRDAGYRLLVDRSVFVFHHGFKSGERLNGPASVANGWNSWEMYNKTNQALIKKHGIKKWWDAMKGSWEAPRFDVKEKQADSEGRTIKRMVKKSDKVILDVGCGPRKTLKRAIGVDYVKKGEPIFTLDGEQKSAADLQADVSISLPVDDGSVDVIIARHILEHLIDPLQALSIWTNKIKSGGRLILALPNEEWHKTIPMNTEHVHAYTPSSAATLLGALGYKDLQFVTSGNRVSFIVEGTRP